MKHVIRIIAVAIAAIVALPVHATTLYDRAAGALGKTIDAAYGGGNEVAVDGNTFLNSLITIINQLITFVGVIFLLLLIYAGYLWMMARGNEEEVNKAKKITRETVIGLILILLARLLTEFILSQIGQATK